MADGERLTYRIGQGHGGQSLHHAVPIRHDLNPLSTDIAVCGCGTVEYMPPHGRPFKPDHGLSCRRCSRIVKAREATSSD